MRIRYFFIVLFLLFSLSYGQNTKQNADFKLAVDLYNDKLYDLALEQFRQFISTYPGNTQSIDARYYVGVIQRTLGKRDEARNTFQNFALNYPDNAKAPDAWWAVGELFTEDNRFADAASAFERIKIFHPKSQLAPKALLTASDNFLRAHDTENARRTLKSLVSDYPTNEFIPTVHLRLGLLLIRDKNFSAARSELLQAAESGAENDIKGSVLLQLGRLAELMNNPGEAEKYYAMVVNEKNIPPTYIVDGQILLSKLYSKQSRSKEAITLLQNISADSSRLQVSTFGTVLFMLGQAYFEQEEYKNASRMFERSLFSLKDTSDLIQAQSQFGKSLLILKDYRRAYSAYSALVALPVAGKEKKEALLRSAVLATTLKNYPQAVSLYLQCTRSFSDDGDAGEVLFRASELCRVQLNDPQRSNDLYRELLSKYPRSTRIDNAMFRIGQSYELLQSTDKAKEAYSELIKRFPSSEFAPQAQAQLTYIAQYHKADQDQSVQQLALLLGDVILDKPKAELAMRLGDMYFNVLRDYEQAEKQYQKAALAGSDSLKDEAELKRISSVMRLCTKDPDRIPSAITLLKEFISTTRRAAHTDEAKYDLFILQTKNVSSKAMNGIAIAFLDENPNSPYRPAVRLRAANAFKERGLLSESIQEYRTILVDHPLSNEAEEAEAQLGIQLDRLGNVDTALVVLDDYLRTFTTGRFYADVVYEKGEILFHTKRFAEAIPVFELLRSDYFFSDHAVDCTDELAQCYRESNRIEKAIELAQSQIERYTSPLFEDSKKIRAEYLFLAQCYDAMHDINPARSYYTHYVHEDANSETTSVVFAKLAQFDLQENNKEGAIRNLERSVLVHRNPSNTEQLAALYFTGQQYAKVNSEYAALLSLSIDSATARHARLRIILSLYRMDKKKDAEQKSAEFIKRYGQSKESGAVFLFEKAMMAYRNEEYVNTLAMLKALPVEFDSTQTIEQAYFWIGKTFEAMNIPDSAFTYYALFLRIYPQSELLPKVYLAMGNIYFFKEKYDDAIKYYRLIVDAPNRNPDLLPYAMNNLIEAYKETGLSDAALELTRNFIERYPDDESVMNKRIDLGVLYAKLGYYDQSIVQLHSLLETTNKDLEAEIRYSLGESYYYKGDYQQAILEFLKVPYLITKKTKLDWTPNSYYMSGQSYEKLGKFDQAVNMYQQIIDKSGIDPSFKAAAQKEINRVKSLMKKESQ